MPTRSFIAAAALVGCLLPATALAQSDSALSVRVPSLSQLAAERAQGLQVSSFIPTELPSAHRSAGQVMERRQGRTGYYRRADWEMGRALIGSAMGLTAAWFLDLVIHYERDFSQANPLLNQKPKGEVVYNILLYGGLSPYFALRGIRSVNPHGGNPTAAYIGGVAGTLLGMVYWTSTEDRLSRPGIAVTCLLTTIGTTMGNNLFGR